MVEFFHHFHTVDEAVTRLFTDAGADCVIKKPLRIEDFEVKLKQYGFIKGETIAARTITLTILSSTTRTLMFLTIIFSSI